MYQIDYSHEAIDHLRKLTAGQRKLILDAVDDQLLYEPTAETKKRILMRPNPLAIWELRISDFRVYYDVENEPQSLVVIRAVGIKDRNVIWIGGEEVTL